MSEKNPFKPDEEITKLKGKLKITQEMLDAKTDILAKTQSALESYQRQAQSNEDGHIANEMQRLANKATEVTLRIVESGGVSRVTTDLSNISITQEGTNIRAQFVDKADGMTTDMIYEGSISAKFKGVTPEFIDTFREEATKNVKSKKS